MMQPTNGDLSQDELERLRQFDTCTLSNAIERLRVRPRNEGFISGVVTCRFPRFEPVIGYAVTARMRSSVTPSTASTIMRTRSSGIIWPASAGRESW